MSVNFTPTLTTKIDLKPFRFWCQKVLPVVYDDSLTYQELLGKVVDLLNKTMEDVSLSIEDVEGLHAAYEQLQGYVNDYFDNLDVQEEINNKLDAMVEDGTFDALVSPYIDEFETELRDDMDALDAQVNNLIINNTTNLSGLVTAVAETGTEGMPVSPTVSSGVAEVAFTIPNLVYVYEVAANLYEGAIDAWTTDGVSYRFSGNNIIVVTVTGFPEGNTVPVRIQYGYTEAVSIPELTDIRVGANGTTYPTAGDAVRGQITDLKEDLNESVTDLKSAFNSNQLEIKNNLSLLDLSYGINRCNPTEIVSGKGMAADGTEYNSTTYSHTGYIPVEPGDIVRLYSNYNVGESANIRTIYAIIAFDANKTVVPASGGSVGATSWTVPAGIYSIIITQQSAQIVDRIPVVTLNEEINTIVAYVAPVYLSTPEFEAKTIDNTLTKAGFSADAKTTGDRIEAVANNFAVEKQKSDYIAKIYPIVGTKISADAVLSQAGKIIHCGKNLFDQSQFLKNTSITFDGEWYYGSGGQFNSVLSQLVLPPFKPHTTYILSYTVYASVDNMYWKAGWVSDDGRTRYAEASSTTAERRVMVSTPPAYLAKGNPANITGLAFTFANSGYIHIKDFMIVEADYDDDTFAPYVGETVNVTSPYHAEFTAFDGENNVYAPGGTVSVSYFTQRKSHRENAVVICMGDSITGNYPSSTVPDSYPDLIAETTGMNVSNCGFGGCRMSLHVEEPKAPFSFCSLVDSIVSGNWTSQDTQALNESNHIDHVFAHIQNLKATDWTKVEYITLFYGTNDWTGQVTLDNQDNSKDTSTYLGAFRYGYEKLMAAYPNVKFIVITPMYRFFSDPPSDTETKQYNGKYIYDFGDALIEVCKGYHIPYIDMYRESGVNAYTRTNYIDDGTHPTEAGIVNLANIIGGKVMAS